MSVQYQDRKEYFINSIEKRTKKDCNKRDMITMKRIKIGKKNMLSNGNWCACKNKNTLKRTKLKSMNTDAVSMLKIRNK